MHQPVVSVDARDTLLTAGETMVARHIRHLVLADGTG
jgi:hypothetical protein